MAYVLPTFNLNVNVWRGPQTLPPGGAPDLTPIGNLAAGRRLPFDNTSAVLDMYLLLPAGTDIRSSINATDPDVVEVPAGSGRFYLVAFVDDLGKGFANEHRFAVLLQTGTWPAPIP